MVLRGVIGFIAGWATWRYWFYPAFGDGITQGCDATDWSPCYLGWIFAFAFLVAVITVLFGKTGKSG